MTPLALADELERVRIIDDAIPSRVTMAEAKRITTLLLDNAPLLIAALRVCEAESAVPGGPEMRLAAWAAYRAARGEKP